MSDGLTDLRDNYKLDYEFNVAEHGNVVLTGEFLKPSTNSRLRWRLVAPPMGRSPRLFRH